MKSFGTWDTQEIRDILGVDYVTDSALLEKWANTNEVITEKEAETLEELRKELVLFNEAWNEDELKMEFISPLLRLIHYGAARKYKIFYQRSISAKVQDLEIGGIIDMLVAKGWERPKSPYFFLHEYKQEQGGKGDARGQLLAAMITAQTLNQDDMPIFGVYLVGASWRFVVLEKQQYAVKRFDATESKDIKRIFQMLKWIKTYIETDLGLINNP